MLPVVHYFDVASSVSFEDRTEVRGRVVDSAVVADVETDPAIRYRGSVRNNLDVATLAYFPRVVFTNMGGDDQSTTVGGQTFPSDARRIDLIHQMGLGLEWQIGPRTRFISNSIVNYGTAALATLLVQPRWNGEDKPLPARPFPINAKARFTFLAINTGTGFFHFITPRLSIAPQVFFYTYGGPDFEARKQQPYLQNPGIMLQMQYAATRTDDIILEVAPQVNVFTSSVVDLDKTGAPFASDGTPYVNPATQVPRFVTRDLPPVYQVYSEVRARHRFTELVTGELAAGTNATTQTRSVDEDDPYNFKEGPTKARTRFFPLVEALTNVGFHTMGAKGRLIAYSRLNSWLNLLNGDVQSRSETVIAASFTAGRNTLRVLGGMYVVAPWEDSKFRQVIGEVGYDRALTQEWKLDFGFRGGQQVADVANVARVLPTDPATVENSTFQPSAFIGLSFQPTPSKF